MQALMIVSYLPLLSRIIVPGVTEETSNSVMQRHENSEGCSVDKRAVKGAPKDFVEVNNFRSTVGKQESSLPT